jgi:NhaA family Na+:H+ antiporter
LFIAQLTYDDPDVVNTAKIGIFTGSVLSGIVGAWLMSRGPRPHAT